MNEGFADVRGPGSGIFKSITHCGCWEGKPGRGCVA